MNIFFSINNQHKFLSPQIFILKKKKHLKYKGDKSTDPHFVKPTGIKLILYRELPNDIAIS